MRKFADDAGLVNLQDDDGEAEPYQVRQFLKLVEEHDLSPGDEGTDEVGREGTS